MYEVKQSYKISTNLTKQLKQKISIAEREKPENNAEGDYNMPTRCAGHVDESCYVSAFYNE